MLRLHFDKPPRSGYTVLCLGSHPDDIEIGCGGTILHLLAALPNVEIYWVVFSSTPKRAEEARASANAFLQPVAKKHIVIKEFKDGFFPYSGAEIKQYFEELKPKLVPDIIFTHYRHDLHQDHRLICELTWNTWRDHLILEYEIPKYDGDFGTPNFFVELEESLCHRKARYILDNFGSQHQKHWFSEETFLAMLRLRGMECRATSKYAEGFYSRKLVLGG